MMNKSILCTTSSLILISLVLYGKTQARDIILHTASGNRDLAINAVSEPDGYIISHNEYGSRNYFRNTDSSATLVGLAPNQVVTITFTGFEMYYIWTYPGCDEDYLQISGLASGSRKYCSDSAYSPPLNRDIKLTARSNRIKFRFVTNSNGASRGEGFRLRYRVLPLPTTTTSTQSTIASTTNIGETDMMNGTTIGISVGAVVVALILIAVALILILRRKSSLQKQMTSSTDNPADIPECSYQPAKDDHDSVKFKNHENEYQLAHEVGEQYENLSTTQICIDGEGSNRGEDRADRSNGRQKTDDIELVDNDLYSS